MADNPKDKGASWAVLAMLAAAQFIMVLATTVVNMSSVPPERGSEVGGLQGTVQNLGASLGTALVGSILIASLVSSYQMGVLANPALADVSQQAATKAEENANFVTTEQVRSAAERAGLSSVQTEALVEEYASAQIAALKTAFAGVALFTLLALGYVRHLPTRAGGDEPAGTASSAGATGPALNG